MSHVWFYMLFYITVIRRLITVIRCQTFDNSNYMTADVGCPTSAVIWLLSSIWCYMLCYITVIRRLMSNIRCLKTVIRLDFRRLPGPVFDPPRKETAGRVTRWPCLWRNWKIDNLGVSDVTGSETGLQFSYLFGSKLHQALPYPPTWLSK